jgi:hypothetical protein
VDLRFLDGEEGRTEDDNCDIDRAEYSKLVGLLEEAVLAL